MISPDWPAPPRVHGFVTTREFGDLKLEAVKRKLRAFLPAEPSWLDQVHGNYVVDLDRDRGRKGDAALTRKTASVCAVYTADCLPVLFTDDAGTTVAAAHAGWRGLSGGVLEATVEAMARAAAPADGVARTRDRAQGLRGGRGGARGFRRLRSGFHADAPGALAARPLRGGAREALRPEERSRRRLLHLHRSRAIFLLPARARQRNGSAALIWLA